MSDKRQIHIRLDREASELLDKLLPWVSAIFGADLSASQLFSMGLKELERRYGPVPEFERTGRRKS